MKRFCKVLTAWALALLMLTPDAAALAAGGAPGRAASDRQDHEGYIVKLKEDAEPLVSALSGDHLISEEGRLIFVEDLEQAELLDPEDVEYIEPDYLVELFDETIPEEPAPEKPKVPSDPLYAEYQWNIQQIHGEAAYQQGLTGSGVKVAFIDSGVNTAHEDLAGASITGQNFLEDDLTYADDSYGHGTFSSGILTAQTDNGLGLAGLVPGIELHAYRVFSGKNTKYSILIKALDQAVKDGCQVINMSLGSTSISQGMEEAVARAVEAGAVVVAAVGNSGNDKVQYPAGHDGVIGVGSVDRDMNHSSFSQTNETVDFVAPGREIAGLGNTAPDEYKLDLESGANRGTSFAAPIVSGMAAMALEYDSTLTSDMIYELLCLSAVDRGETGRDDEYGNGVVDVKAFLEQLTREYTITYQTGGAQLPEDTVLTYRLKNERPALPVPGPLEGKTFLGWFLTEDCSGAPLEAFPAEAVGDLTLYAGWRDDELAVSLQSVSVNGVTAAAQEDGTYQAVLPYGTDLAAVTAEQVQAVPSLESSGVEVVPGETQGTFTLTVTSAPPVLTRTYRLDTVLSQLRRKAEVPVQTGTAAPASLDGLTKVVPYQMEDAGLWFEMADGSQLPENFTLEVRVSGGAGDLKTEQRTVTYIPAAEDAGQTVRLSVCGVSEGAATLEALEIDIAVGALPPSQPVMLTEAVDFDLAGQEQAELQMNLYGDTVEEVFLGGSTLTREHYSISAPDEEGTTVLTLLKSAVDKLKPGMYPVRVTLAGGGQLDAELTLKTSAVLTGTVTSAGEGEASVELFAAGAAAPAYSVTTVQGRYTVENVAPGTYSLEVSKDHHVTRTYEITIEGDTTLDVDISLLGDVNQDGRVDTRDWTRLYKHTNGVDPLEGYALDCANVNGDQKTDTRDWTRLYKHANGTQPLW